MKNLPYHVLASGDDTIKSVAAAKKSLAIITAYLARVEKTARSERCDWNVAGTAAWVASSLATIAESAERAG